MKLGFTGTREGMTPRQKQGLALLLDSMLDVEFHHGDCIGADSEAAMIAISYQHEVHAHPCNLPFMRGQNEAHTTYEIEPPLQRNMDIVNMTDMLIAAPKAVTPAASGGTWFTIRYASKVGKPVLILEP